MSYLLEIILILIFTSVACTLPGVYLVLRKWAMMGDAISHTVLLGIVIAFLIFKDLSSPYLLLGASIFALLSVYCVELLSKSARANIDSALGITFTFFFSVAVIIVSRLLTNTHIDIDVVLLGEVAFAPLRRINFWGYSLPYSLVQMAIICLINLALILIFFRGLKVSSFDNNFSKVIRFNVVFFQILLMTMVSISTVAAFDAVGAILVVSFLITPAATAYLFTHRLSLMLAISVLFAIVESIIGAMLAVRFNVPYSGAVASLSGFVLLLAFLFNRSGLIMDLLSKKRLKKHFQADLLVLHLYNHRPENDSNFISELGQFSILRHLNWSENKLKKQKEFLMKRDVIKIDEVNHVFLLTEKGVDYAEKIKLEYNLHI